MRKILLLIILFSLVASGAYGGMIIRAVDSSPTCSGFAGDSCTDFNTDGENSSAPSGWDSIKTPNSYDSSSPTMEGSQNFYMSPEDGAQRLTIASDGELWVVFAFEFSEGIESNETVFRSVASNGSTYIHYFRLLSIEYMSVTALGGTANDSTTTILQPDTTYYIKLYLNKGTGANGTITAWLWDGSSWGQECTSTNGDRSSDIVYLDWKNDADTEDMWIDLVKYDLDSDITTP